MRLYKYTDRAIDILKRLELKVSPPNQFDDPFEFTPCFDEQRSTKQRVKKHLKENSKVLYRKAVKGRLFSGTLDEFEQSLLQDENLAIARETLRKENYPKKILSWASRNYAVACFSERHDNMLMWSHYAAGHRGVVLEIESNAFLGAKENLRKVRYCRRPAKWNLLDRRTMLGTMETKWRGWKYVNEWRLLFDLRDCRKSKNKKSWKPIYFVPLQNEQITKVILGWRCSRASEKRIKTLLQTDNLKHIELWKAALYQDEYKLDFKQCNLNS